MSHSAIPVWAMALGFEAIFLLARVAAVRERGLGVITTLVFGAQLGLHLLFTVAEPVANEVPAMPAAPGMPAMPGMPGVAVEHGHVGPLGHLSAGMVCGHVLAALVAAWWLRRGEEAVHRYAAWAAARLGAPMAVLHRLHRLLVGDRAGLAGPAPVGQPPSRSRAAGGRLIRFAVTRRGPPAGASLTSSTLSTTG